MDKKYFTIFGAIIAFFAGAIWATEVPTVATLVAFLEVCAGFGFGFLFKKFVDEEAAAAKEKTLKELRANNVVEEQVAASTAPAPKAATKKKTPSKKKN